MSRTGGRSGRRIATTPHSASHDARPAAVLNPPWRAGAARTDSATLRPTHEAGCQLGHRMFGRSRISQRNRSQRRSGRPVGNSRRTWPGRRSARMTRRPINRNAYRRWLGILACGVALPLALGGCPPTPVPPASFGITASTKPIDPSQGTFELYITGTGFTKFGTVSVRYAKIPNLPSPTAGAGAPTTVDASGTIHYAEAMVCTSKNPSDAQGTVFIVMNDNGSGNFADTNISAAPWVNTTPGVRCGQ